MRNKRGMTLIEIMVSVILFVLCIAGVMALIYHSTVASYSVYYTYLATNLAKNRIEWIREHRANKGYLSLGDLPAEQIDMIDRYGNSGEDFERTTQVEYSPEQSKITVMVDFKRREVNVPIKVELVTLLQNY